MAPSVIEFLNGKNMLLTGSTGFLGKILIEKILRTQPQISCIFVLIRASDVESAKLRLRNEVVNMELFKILKEQHGNDEFDKFFFSKVVPILGDVAADNLGIESESKRDELCEKLDLIVNSAANTVFDERYDVALNVNAKGARSMLEFANRCSKLQVLLHVSTAYVSGRRGGILTEKTLKLQETTTESNPGSSPQTLDIASEFDLLEKTLAQLETDASVKQEKSPEDAKSKRLKELGLERAKLFGFPNTYTFTKAMGEMLVSSSRGNLPVVIVRPSIIESTLADPFPGWIEGSRTIDTLILAYGKGRLSSFLADPDLVVDVIPADMVVNAMMTAMAIHALENDLFVYQVASSVANPLRHSVGIDAAYKYFSENPCVGKDGNLIHVKEPQVMESMNSFRRYMLLHYKAPLQFLGVVDNVFCKIFRERYNLTLRRYNFVMYLADLYEPYAFFEGRFDITNTEGLLAKLHKADEKRIFNFDVKSIDWVHYFGEIHIPGLVKHVLK